MHRLTLVASSLLLCAATTALAAGTPRLSESRARPAGSDTAEVHLGPAGEGTDAFVAWPAGTERAPAVIVLHEWWGLNGQIREIARRLAQQGYVAIAPDLYHGKLATDPEKAHELSRALDPSQALADLDASVAWIRAQPRSAKTRVGVMGFCMGGGLALQFAIHSPGIAAAVMFYGAPESDSAKIAALKAPLQGHFGADDQGITPDRVDEFRAALKRAGKNADLYIYPGAGHAFMHEGRDSYRESAARQAWARTLDFLQKYLKG